MALARSECWICAYCDGNTFRTERDFISHLRVRHSLIEGGSYVCRYGYNDVCCSLPVVGVSADDYEKHVVKQHVTRPRSDVGRRCTLPTNIGVRARPGGAVDLRDMRCTLPANVGVNARPRFLGDSPYRVTISPLDRTSEDSSRGLSGTAWNIYSGSQNLAAVLNDPSIGKQQHFFTRDWGDNFTEFQTIKAPVNLPDISWGNCESYARAFAKFNQIHTKEAECTSKPSMHSDLLKHFPMLRSARLLKELVQTDMNNVPRVFFDPNFHLGKKNHFDRVFLTSRQMNSSSNAESEGHNEEQNYNVVIKGSRQSVQLLQAQLSHYLDVVEVQISKQVEQQSDVFFQSITSHEDLMEKLATTVKLVKVAREEVRRIEDTFVQRSLKMLRLKKVGSLYVQVLKKLKLMAIVTKSRVMVDNFLSSSDYMAALELVRITKDILNRELMLIKSLRFQGSQLSEMEQMIDKRLIAEFEQIVTEDLNDTSLNNDMNCDRNRFGQVVYGILRQRHFHCVDTFKYQVIKLVKDMVKAVEIEMIRSCDTTVVGQFSLTEHLKCLHLPNWITFFKEITGKLLILITRVKHIKDLIQEAIEKCIKKTTQDDEPLEDSDQTKLDEGFFSKDDSNKMSSKLNDMMIATCDFANHQVSKMINSYWLVDKASASQFRDLGRVVDEFTARCRDVCGRSSSSLHSAFTAQANKFVQTFHQERKGKLTLILNSECWKRVDVPTEFQVLVNDITESGNFSLLKLNSHASKPLEVMTVNNEAYIVVGSVLILLKMTTEYCVCASDLLDMAPNVYRYLVELLQFFNARSCQLLLGANALYTAGLKSITSRNLSLASRNLQFIVCLLPFIREHFQTTVGPNPKTSHCSLVSSIKMFDLVKRDIEKHVVEIETKIKTLITSLITNQLNQWEASLPVPSKAFRNISKQLQKLHGAIGDILPPLQLQEIFRCAHEFFMVKLREQLTELNILSIADNRSTSVALDIKCYVNALSKLNVIPTHGLNRIMDEIWVLPLNGQRM